MSIPAAWLGLFAAVGAVAAPAFRPQTVDDTLQIGYGIAVADVDGDRHPDLVLADKHRLLWYRNPDWTRHVISERLTPLDHVCVAAADLDGDGRVEIAAGAGWNPGDTRSSGALFFLLPPADRTQPWTPLPLAHEPTEHRIRWARDATGRWSLVSLPLHGRGNDPATGTGAGVRVYRHLPPPGLAGEWQRLLLHEALNKTHNFDVVQWDDDPADELVIASRQGLYLSDPQPDGTATLTLLATNALGGMGEVRAGRLGDGRRFLVAIEPMHGHSLALFLPPAGDGPWSRTVLDDSLVDGHALATGDLLGLGQDQIVVGWRAMNRPEARVGIKLLVAREAGGDRKAGKAADGSNEVVEAAGQRPAPQELWCSRPGCRFAGQRPAPQHEEGQRPAPQHEEGQRPAPQHEEGQRVASPPWDIYRVDDNTMACEDLTLADLDGDGDLDIAAAGRATRNVKIYWNQRLKPD